MRFEFVDFYPVKTQKKKLLGTVHIYIVDLLLHIRGCPVWDNGSSIVVKLPYSRVYDQKLKKHVRYPLISFALKPHHEELNKFLKGIVPEVEERMKEKGVGIKSQQ